MQFVSMVQIAVDQSTCSFSRYLQGKRLSGAVVGMPSGHCHCNRLTDSLSKRSGLRNTHLVAYTSVLLFLSISPTIIPQLIFQLHSIHFIQQQILVLLPYTKSHHLQQQSKPSNSPICRRQSTYLSCPCSLRPTLASSSSRTRTTSVTARPRMVMSSASVSLHSHSRGPSAH